jgi:DNA polymerase delta subunit 2
VIAAALGAETPSGEFEVVDLCFAGAPPQSARPIKTEEEGSWVAIVSGLELGGNADLDDFRADLLAEYLSGELADTEVQDESSKISHLILAGNSMRQPTRPVAEVTKKKKYGYDPSSYSAKPTAALNRFLSNVLPSLNVTILPGERDPTIPTMPQQPLHKALLPDTVPFGEDAFATVTNPCFLTLDGIEFLGTSGQTLDDIYKYLEEENRLDMLNSTLDWSHLAPTAPDTLCESSSRALILSV